jgi:hypothetical protein
MVILSALSIFCGAVSPQEKIDQVKQKNHDALLASRRQLADITLGQNSQVQSPEALFNRSPSHSTVTSSYGIPTSSFNNASPYFHQNRQNSPTLQRSAFTQERNTQFRQQNQFDTFSQFSSSSVGESISAASQAEISYLRGSSQ